MDKTVAVIATPRGTGGVAVIQVVGPDAKHVALKCGLKLDPAPAFNRFGDDVLAHFAKTSPWKLPVVEISCPGGAAAPGAVIARLGVSQSTVEALDDDAVRRRVMNRIEAEARRLLPIALTDRAAAMLMSHAALARAILKDPRRLLSTARIGRALVEPLRVVIAGRPNAGKSTLFNALVRRDRALVSEIAGTTRDPVEETIALDGFPLRLVDTAGFTKAAAGPDAEAVARSQEEVDRAGLVIWVRDAREPSRGTGRIKVANKMDLAGATYEKGEIPASAKTEKGLDKLRRAILAELGFAKVPRAAVFTARQQTFLEALAAGARVSEIRKKLLWT